MASGSLVSPHVSGSDTPIVRDGSDGRGLSGGPDAYLHMKASSTARAHMRRELAGQVLETVPLALGVVPLVGRSRRSLKPRAILSPVVAPPSAAGLT